MRILIVGDQHFRVDLPYSAAFKDGRRAEWEEVKRTIIQASKDCEAVILLGDNLNSRHNNSSVIREFIQFLKDFGEKQIYILVGNHERYGKSTALDFITKIHNPKWTVVDSPHMAELGKIKFGFLPFMTPGSLDTNSVEECQGKLLTALNEMGKVDVLCTHHAIQGAKWAGGSAEHMNEPVLPLEIIEQHADAIFAGHIHAGQRLSHKTLLTGSIFTSEVGEEDKSVYVYDTSNHVTEEIPLPVRGIYKFDIDKVGIFRTVPRNSIVKAYITDRSVDAEQIRGLLSSYDAHIIIEQYPREREKVHFEGAAMDLTVDKMLEVYSEARKIDYNELKEGFDLIR